MRLQRWARKKAKQLTMRQKILGGLVVGVASVSAILMLVFHSQILHAMLPVANKLRFVHSTLEGSSYIIPEIQRGVGRE